MFEAFSLLALQGFGGVIAIAQRELVERRRWLTQAEFLELLAAGQVLPGPNVVNVALMVGDRFFGWRGALASVAGMLLLPMAVVLTAAALYGRLAADMPALAGALRGMGAVSAGMILATGLKLVGGLRKQPLGLRTGLVYAGCTALAVGGLRWPMVAVVLGLGGTAMAHVIWVLRRGASS